MRTLNYFTSLSAAAVLLFSASAHAQGQMHKVLPNSANMTADGTLAHEFNSESSASANQHLTIGHSMFIDTRSRLTRVYATNPALLTSFTSSPNQVVVTALKPGTSTFIAWDETGESETYLITNDIDVSGLRAALKSNYPQYDLTVMPNEDRIELSGVVGKRSIADDIVKLAAVYSKQVVDSLVVNAAVVKQVRLKVRFIEIDRSKAFQYGLNLFSANGSTLAQSTTGQFSSTISASTSSASTGGTGGTSIGGTTVTVTNPLNFTVYSAKYNIGLTLQDLEAKNVAQILAEPNITAMSGEKAEFLAGGEFPFPTVQSGAGGSTAITISFRPYGVKLAFTPTVNADNTIDLKIAPEVSALDYSNAVSISGYTIPALSTRNANTEVVLQSGQSFAMSGLLDQRTTDNLNRTPGIANVPILGLLFKSKSTTKSQTELVVIVTPEIINPLTEKLEEPPTPHPVVPLLDTHKFDKSVLQKDWK
jgi:pilus assembly protein CpaC